MSSQKTGPINKEKAIQVIERFILKYPEVDLLKEYVLALKATDFDSVRSLFKLQDRYHEDLNGILKDDQEWAKGYPKVSGISWLGNKPGICFFGGKVRIGKLGNQTGQFSEWSQITNSAPFFLFNDKVCSESISFRADHDRFRFQADAPDFFHTLLNVFFQSDDIGGCGLAAIDDGQGVLGGNADAAKAESFVEPGALDQPGRGNFLAGFERGIAGQG